MPPTCLDRPIIIGAGPAGLSAAWALAEAGLRPLILEGADRPFGSWHSYYPSLRMNSWRPLSSLPGMRLPVRCGPWPSRDDFLTYAERYIQELAPDIRYGTWVERIDRTGPGWTLRTGAGEFMTHHVVVAAGLHRTPHLPLWPGIDSYRGELIHARAYRGPSPYIGRDVLIVGCGPTGMDIATELAGSGAGRVRVSIRNSPLLFRLSPLTSLLSQATKHLPLPTTVIDRASLLLYRLHWGDLSALGFAAPREGLATALARSGHTAGTIDRGLVSAVRRGAIEIVAEVVALDHDQVRLGSGDAIRPDVVIAATGQRPNLTEQAGHLDVLAAAGGRPLTHGGRTLDHAPGLYFIGYRVPSGQLPDLAIDARAIARAIAGMGRITQWRRRLTSAAGSRGPGRAEVLSLSRNTSSPTPGGVCDVDPNR